MANQALKDIQSAIDGKEINPKSNKDGSSDKNINWKKIFFNPSIPDGKEKVIYRIRLMPQLMPEDNVDEIDWAELNVNQLPLKTVYTHQSLSRKLEGTNIIPSKLLCGGETDKLYGVLDTKCDLCSMRIQLYSKAKKEKEIHSEKVINSMKDVAKYLFSNPNYYFSFVFVGDEFDEDGTPNVHYFNCYNFGNRMDVYKQILMEILSKDKYEFFNPFNGNNMELTITYDENERLAYSVRFGKKTEPLLESPEKIKELTEFLPPFITMFSVPSAELVNDIKSQLLSYIPIEMDLEVSENITTKNDYEEHSRGTKSEESKKENEVSDKEYKDHVDSYIDDIDDDDDF